MSFAKSEWNSNNYFRFVKKWLDAYLIESQNWLIMNLKKEKKNSKKC